jgi:hypothetical protein
MRDYELSMPVAEYIAAVWGHLITAEELAWAGGPYFVTAVDALHEDQSCTGERWVPRRRVLAVYPETWVTRAFDLGDQLHGEVHSSTMTQEQVQQMVREMDQAIRDVLMFGARMP